MTKKLKETELSVVSVGSPFFQVKLFFLTFLMVNTLIRSRRKRKVEKIDLERGSNCVKAISAPDTLMMFPSRRDCQLVLWRMIMIMRVIMRMMIMRMMIMAIIMTMIMVVSSS